MLDEPPLIAAARADAFERLNQLLDQGEDPNQTNQAKETALILAAQRGFEKAVERLLQAGGDPLQYGGDYTVLTYNALGFASKNGNFNILRMLQQAIKLDTPTNMAWHRSVGPQNGYISLYDDALLATENIYCDPTIQTSIPPLIQAIYRDDFQAFRDLLAQGADPHETLGNGLAALHAAIRFHRHAIFDTLLEHRVNIDQTAAYCSYSPLFVAVKVRNRYAYHKLTLLGAQDPPTSEHHTALFPAVYLNDMEAIRELVLRGSNIHQYARDPHFTLVYCAARYGHIEALEYLLSLGLKPDGKGNGQSFMNHEMWPGPQITPLTAAVKNGDLQAVEVLLKAGADPNRPSGGILPLFFAIPHYRFPNSETLDYQEIISRYSAIIDLLVQYGADLNLRSKDGSYALFQAIALQQEEIALHLIKSGALVNIQDKQGRYPAQLASYIDFRAMNAAEILEEFILSYLVPTLKSLGYENHQDMWWKNKEDRTRVIHLQTYPWNTKTHVDFCFYIGDAPKGKAQYTYFDMPDPLPESFFLPERRQKHRFKNSIGYGLTPKSELIAFMREIQTDFEYLREKL